MITENYRDSLITYRLGQAKDSIELARFLIDSDKLVVAVNRIYYGIYYSLTALAIQNKFETSKHMQLIGWFLKNFIATGVIDIRFGKILKSAYNNRTKGDYDAFIVFTKDEVETMLNEMIEYIGEIEKIIKAYP